ncbi:MAG: MBL fold metallo-hydrolase [Acidobacteriota bacterium]
MALLFQVLASGSKGNAVLVSSPKTRILLDAGLSAKELVKRLDRTSVEARLLDGIVITHEHQDHVRGAGVLSRRFSLPVHLSEGTFNGLPRQVGTFAHRCFFTPGEPFQIGDLLIQPFSTSHDARDPAAFIIEHEGTRLGVCTDLGVVTQLVRARLQGCHGLVIEANHDLAQLLDGPYPWHLKQRIRSRHGHLSNADTCELLKEIHHPHLRAVTFAHLSEVNNHPTLVTKAFKETLCAPEWESVSFAIAEQHVTSKPVELN